MMILVTYDVNTETAAGKKRLRKIAKACQYYGQRVQNSVFECVVDTSQLIKMKDRLVKLIDPQKDSLRFYVIGGKNENADNYGTKPSFDVTEPIIL